jgi:hypothetical protein
MVKEMVELRKQGDQGFEGNAIKFVGLDVTGQVSIRGNLRA